MLATPDKTPSAVKPSTNYVVLTGNPNCGKTTLFNALTGLRAKVGNYAGVTVERKEGRLTGPNAPKSLTILDLPGTYSLSPQSLDEQIARDVLLNRLPELPPPSLVVVVVDASNLQRNLYYATQVIELGYPTILALNMVDIAEANGVAIDATALSDELGVPVYPITASTGEGLPTLREGIIAQTVQNRAATSSTLRALKQTPQFYALPPLLEQKIVDLAELIARSATSHAVAPEAEAMLLLTDERTGSANLPAEIRSAISEARNTLESAGIDWRTAAIEARYTRIAEIQASVATENFVHRETLSDKLDRILTHKLWGMLIFVGIMALMFQSIFTLAEYPMNWIEGGVKWLGNIVGAAIPPGDLNSLIVDGAIAGVGAVVVFLPQICLLFLFIGLLEDTGYMARAAFLMDRLMSKVGLHGKSFIPMLSSFACAIPGIMATRTIETPKDRLVTILVAPLMSCSARLPVYTLLIAACIPQEKLLGIFGVQGLTMLSMYLLGIVMALLMAWLFKKTLLKGEAPLLIMELPPYKRPVFFTVLRHMWERAKVFLRRAGTVILGISIILWFLATYPRSSAIDQEFAAKRQTVEASTAADSEARELQLAAIEHDEAGAKLRNSFAGRLGHLIEPAIRPLGFDWKIGIGIVASFAAREVFVSTMSTVYNVGSADDNTDTIAETLKEQKREDGTAVYTPLVGITIMVFYVLALQCVSTIAIVRRETNSWRWPLFQWSYMAVLAWILAFITYQGGKLLGFQ
ncbi:MAG TPA: ferrous iron transport protein B [Verrucomicrobiae bacterium]